MYKIVLPPVIILKSKPDTYALPGHAYEEEGFTAMDNYDGTITDRVKSTAHDGIVTYEVYDSSGNHLLRLECELR